MIVREALVTLQRNRRLACSILAPFEGRIDLAPVLGRVVVPICFFATSVNHGLLAALVIKRHRVVRRIKMVSAAQNLG
jgi:hypothetical protein